MTDWQIKFATGFWSDQLQRNPTVTTEQVTRFVAELSDILRKRKPVAVCTVVKPQVHLALALRNAELPDDALPLTEIDMVFISDGSIQVRKDGEWSERREAC